MLDKLEWSTFHVLERYMGQSRSPQNRRPADDQERNKVSRLLSAVRELVYCIEPWAALKTVGVFPSAPSERLNACSGMMFEVCVVSGGI
jgi:hypothetical protein